MTRTVIIRISGPTVAFIHKYSVAWFLLLARVRDFREAKSLKKASYLLFVLRTYA